MSAVIQNEYTGNNSTTTYSFTFPYLKTSDIKASLDGVDTTAFTLPNATTLQFNTAPASNVKIKIFRQTSVDDLTATFYAGSAIKSEDLNDNFTQNLYKTQEIGGRFISNLGGTMTGDLNMGEDTVIKFEGATDDAHETTLTVADPTADRTITLPNVTGTVVTTGDTGTVATAMIANDAINGTKLADNAVNSEHYTDGSIDRVHLAADIVDGTKIADDSINSEHYVADSIDTEHYAPGSVDATALGSNAVTRVKIIADAVDGTKIADDSINSEHYVDGSIDNAHLAGSSISQSKMAADSVGTAQLVDGSVDTARLADNSVTLAKMTDNSVGTSELVDDAVTSAKMANNSVETAAITDGVVTGAKIAANTITQGNIATDGVSTDEIAANAITANEIATAAVSTDELANAAVTTVKLANANITTDKLANTSVTEAKLANNSVSTRTILTDAVTNAKMANNSVNSAELVDLSVIEGKIADNAVTMAKLANGALPTDITVASANIVNGTIVTADLADDAVTNDKIVEGTLDGRYYTKTGAEAIFLRQDSSETIASGVTWSSVDTKVATTAAIDARIIDLVDDVGGFVPIASETAFPTANPDVNNGAGTLVSIKAIGTSRTPSSGTVTIANGSGSNTVTITGCGSTVLAAGFGAIVETTSTLHTYAFHRLVPKATEVTTVAANAVNIAAAGANVTDIHNFADLYQISTSAPTARADSSSLQNGDLWFDSSSNKVMMVYDGTSGDGFSNVTPNASDLANVNIVAGQLVFQEDLGLITNAVATGTGNSSLNTVAGIASNVTTVANNTSNINAVAADATDIGAVAAKATEIGRLGTAAAVADLAILGTNAIVSDMDTLADISSNISTVAGISSNVTSVAGNASNINSAVSNASNINSAVSNASNINTVAGISSNVTTVAGVASNVTTVAGNTTNINAVAGNNSNITTVANNNTNVTNVGGSIANVNSVAGSLSNVNTTAGSISNVNTVASSITDVNTFANRYRIGSSNPTSSLDTGDLFFNTSANELRVYNGSSWQGGVTAVSDLLRKDGGQMTGNITMSGSQTVDGRDLSVDGSKLDGIATGATNNGSGNAISDGDRGNITVSNNGATFVINNDAVSTAKMLNFPTQTILGRETAGTGNATTLNASQVRSIINVENGATADQTASEIVALISGQTIAPNVITTTNLTIDFGSIA